MKVTKLMWKMVKAYCVRLNAKRRKGFPSFDLYEHRFDVNYAGDGNDKHCLDIYYAKENRKNVCVVDIHGGAYIFGDRKDNYPFGTVFLEEGYDFVSIDYVPNDGSRGIENLYGDVVNAINFLTAHLEGFGLTSDRFVLTGDSAGGHLALLLAEACCSKEVEEGTGFLISSFKPEAVLLNCPVYNYTHITGKENATEGANTFLYGPRFEDYDFLDKYSPHAHIDALSIPLFVSTCNNDFIRSEALRLQNDLEKRPFIASEFLDLQSKNKKVAHVHNVTDLQLEESKAVNDAMLRFLQKHLSV